MKIALIHGIGHQGSTWHYTDLICQELSKLGTVEKSEFFLPRDMPHFCTGCYTCFYKGEENCPHRESVKPIAEAMLAADLIVLTSPVYGMDVTGQMKALLDHLCYLWMSHRPDPAMFRKVGLIVSTTAGAGLGHTTKTMKNSMKFWGVKKIFVSSDSVSAMGWEDVPRDKKSKIEQDAVTTAHRIYQSVRDIDRIPNPVFRSIFFRMMVGMEKKNDWNPKDRNHWEENGWLSGKRPF